MRNRQTNTNWKIRHILAEGREVESVAGLVVLKEECPGYYAVLTLFMKKKMAAMKAAEMKKCKGEKDEGINESIS